MKNRVASGISCLLTILVILLNVSGGADSRESMPDLTGGISPSTPTVNTSLLGEKADVYSGFAVRLLRANQTQENTILSPLSTVYGLAMTANGAGGQTLEQLESAVGMSVREMNEYLYSYTAQLDRSGGKLTAANSAWLSESQRFEVEKGYLRTCATWYDAEIFQTKFNEECLKSMNDWVRRNTDGSVGSPVSGFQNTEGIILLNTLLFAAHWQTPFSEDWNDSDKFYREDGTEEFATFMRSVEDLYLESKACTGFMKSYVSDSYVFAALLPAEGTTVDDLLSSMDGQSLFSLFSSPTPAAVHISMPKFSAALSSDIIPSLQRLGITDVFSPDSADLSGIGSDSLYVASIRQDTCITVDEIGTRAAATSAVAEFPASERDTMEDKYVTLDRPFVYMILESENLTPLFVGTVMTTE